MAGEGLSHVNQSTAMRIVVILAILAAFGVGAWIWSNSGAEDTPRASEGSPGSPGVKTVPAVVDVLCDANLAVQVSSDAVAATASGVAVRVTSEAPVGAYLNYGFGGDPMPASPETWMLAAPPGELHLGCSTLEQEGALTTVLVVDPGRYWSDQTLAERGCPVGGQPGWAVRGGDGATPEEAVAQVLANFAEAGVSPTLARYEHAYLGYPDASSPTWIIGTADETYATVMVNESGSSYIASPDYLCVPSPWTVSSS